ncbi:MAG: TlyA family RNA methyltransferase [Firmicutes bacterium]|nr:TlyA family RNA methyltransferase [Bacillota bacterium]
MSKVRLDKACSDLLKTRAKAQDAIKEGRVSVNGKVISKPSFLIEENDEIKIEEKEDDFVSRAGHKLKAAIDTFHISVENQTVLDIGASTGGFSDVCLRHGAKKVYALDVGHLQLAKELDEDSRIVKMEGYNAKELDPADFDPLDFICMDVSFISCKTILERIFEVLPVAHLAILVKPQFECGPKALNKQGVLKDKKLQQKIVEDVKNYVFSKYKTVKVIPSPIVGRSGNQEYILYAKDLR